MNNFIFLNKNLNSLILKKEKKLYIYIYNNNIFLYFYFQEKILINNNLNFLKFCINNNKNNEIKNIFNKIFNFNLKKFLFNGKGFKLKKIKRYNIFNFNNSHIKLLIEKKSKLIKNNKNSFLLLQKFNKSNLKTINFLLKLFNMNIFTKKGIKLSNQIVKLKKIKKK